ncbi:MAG: site-specific integrase [Clostridia bacterium]|nr:site-specific integrase [Clostridia bacterium]
MPKAKYSKDSTGYYYTNVKTNKLRADGYPEYKRVRAKTIKALDEKLQKLEETKLLHEDASKITVDQWYKIWFTSYKSDLAPSTQDYYKNLYTKHISPNIGTFKLISVNETQCQSILTGMSKNDYSIRTVKGVRKVLFSLFDKAQKNRYIPVNPCTDLTANGAKQKDRRALTEEERNAYLKACREHEFGTFAAFLYFFGLRRGEALALTGTDILSDKIRVSKQLTFPDNNQPHLAAPKTAAGVREIPIPTKARFYINFNNIGSGYLFTGTDSKPLTYSEARRRWNSFLKCAFPEGTDITEHYLRHNYCSMLFENEVDLLTVRTLAGHEDISTTLEIYTHYTEKMQTTASKKILSIG